MYFLIRHYLISANTEMPLNHQKCTVLTLAAPFFGDVLFHSFWLFTFLVADLLRYRVANFDRLKAWHKLGYLTAHLLGDQVTLLSWDLNSNLIIQVMEDFPHNTSIDI